TRQVTGSALDTVDSTEPRVLHVQRGTVEGRSHAGSESIQRFTGVQRASGDHLPDFGTGFTHRLADELRSVDTALTELDQILTGDLPGCSDLRHDERDLRQRLRVPTRSSDGICDRVQIPDNLV